MATKSKYCYSVYDNLKKKNILDDVPLRNVVNQLGMQKDKVALYAVKGYVFNRRYVISRRLLDGTEIEKDAGVKVDPEFEREWDKVCLMINPKARG